MASLVSNVWLRQHLLQGLKNLSLIDGSWHPKSSGRNALQEYKERRIDNAVFIDIDELSDQTSDLPNMLPSDQQFSEHIGNLGITDQHHIVIYDNNDNTGMFSSARLWWMFKTFGHQNVSILDGGLPRWLAEGGPVLGGEPIHPTTVKYNARKRRELVKTMDDIVQALKRGDIQIVDARSAERFNGVVPEPRPDLCSGHMIGAINLPYTKLFNMESKTFASNNVIEQEFANAGLDLSKPIIATCGSGVTACWISFAAFLLGKDVPVYDGSWTEYAQYGPKQTFYLGISSNDGN